MSFDFYVVGCQTSTHESEFGSCDALPGDWAYIETNEPETWSVTVKNNQQKELIFTAGVNNSVFQRAL